MIFVSAIIACLMIGGGVSAIFYGAGIIVLERGWSMVIAGSIIATGGFILLGLVMLLRELRRMPDRIAEAMPEVSKVLQEQSDAVTSSFRPKVDFHLKSQMARKTDPMYPEFDAPLPTFGEPAASLEKKAKSVFTEVERQTTKSAEAFVPIIDAPVSAAFEQRNDPLPRVQSVNEPHVETKVNASHGEMPVQEEGEDRQSALKIQISLHGQSFNDTSRKTFDFVPVEEDIKEKQSGTSIWSKIGRGKKARNEASQPPLGPTAADLARERLTLADIPLGEAEREERLSIIGDTTDMFTIESRVEQQETGAVFTPAEVPLPIPIDIRPEAQTFNAQAEKTPQEPVADLQFSATAENIQHQIVGSYQAGNNTYIMYDDGTIEAETPQGIFRFETLDGLKAFIASGEDPAFAGARIEREPISQGQEASA